MAQEKCIMIGAPIDSGKQRRGCLMGPDAYRTAGLGAMLAELGYWVEDRGNLTPRAAGDPGLPEKVHAGAECVGWTLTLETAARQAMGEGFPIFLGGDHAMSLGTVSGVARHAAAQDRPQFVLWLDAHSDFHTPHTTDSGNLHGTPLAYVSGRGGFDGFPAIDQPIPEENICIIGLRSVDDAERTALQQSAIRCHDMRAIDETGISAPLLAFLDRVARANGFLHVSLDVDFLDPSIAPGVGTAVPGGATFREAHLVMEIVHDSGLATSLDLAELNPFLDERGRTAQLMVDLAASIFGRKVFDRPTPGLV